jgi:hypothetical protein
MLLNPWLISTAPSAPGSHSIFIYNALHLWQAAGGRSGEALTLYAIAVAQRDNGKFDESRARIESALSILESLRTKIGIRALRSSFFASKQDYYEFYIDLLMRMHKERPLEGYDALALHAVERARSRTLLEALAEAGVDIRETSPSNVARKYPEPLKLEQIQKQVLDSDTLLLEYALGKDRSYLWAVTPESIDVYELPKREEIERAVLHFYDLITGPQPGKRPFETDEEQRKREMKVRAATE